VIAQVSATHATTKKKDEGGREILKRSWAMQNQIQKKKKAIGQGVYKS